MEHQDLPNLFTRDELATERTQLAAERTFLSWIRTGLTGVAGGLAVARLIAFQTLEHKRIAQWVGELLIVWGIIIFIFGLISYRRNCRRFTHLKDYQQALWQVVLIVVTVIILSLVLLFILIS